MGAYVDFSLDIKLTSIMFTIANINVLMDFEAAEDRDPSPRKKLNDRTIYQSRQFRSQEFGVPKLCDFGEARFGAIKRDDFIQPDSYSPPELLLQTSWDHKVDIWMVGILVMLSLFPCVCEITCVMDC